MPNRSEAGNAKKVFLKDIRRAIQNIEERQRLMREGNVAELQTIGLFVLLVGKLEASMKAMVLRYGKRQLKPTLSLGAYIGEVRGILRRKVGDCNVKGSKNYSVKNSLFQKESVDRFLERCEEITQLRNDLIHQFIWPKKSSCGRVEDLLRAVKSSISLSLTPQQQHAKLSEMALRGEGGRNAFLRENVELFDGCGRIHATLSIDNLTKMCSLYNQYLGI